MQKTRCLVLKARFDRQPADSVPTEAGPNSTPLPVSRMRAAETTGGATSRQTRVQHLLTRSINPSAVGDRFEASPMTRSPTYDRNGDP